MFKITIDSYVVVRTNKVRSCVHFTKFAPKISCNSAIVLQHMCVHVCVYLSSLYHLSIIHNLYYDEEINIALSINFIQIRQFYMHLFACICMYFVLCNFITYVDSCDYQQNQVTGQFHHHKDLLCYSFIITDSLLLPLLTLSNHSSVLHFHNSFI